MEQPINGRDSEQVARTLIWLASRDGETINNYRLNKILYYAQARSLARYGRRLLAENVRAYDRGPVIGSVRYKFKTYPPTAIDASEGRCAIDGEDLAFLAAIWEDYKHLSDADLERMVHEEEPLWKQYYKPRQQNGGSSPVIPDSAIRNYFSAQAQPSIPQEWVDILEPPPDEWLRRRA